MEAFNFDPMVWLDEQKALSGEIYGAHNVVHDQSLFLCFYF